MTLKKLSAMLVSCALAGTLFTGCGGDTAQTQSQKNDIQLGMLKNLNVSEQIYEKIMEKFEENAGIKLNSHQVVFFDDLSTMQIGLKGGQIDELSIYKCVSDYLMAMDPNFEMAKDHVGKKKISDNFSFAMRAEDTELKNSINAALEEMKKDGTLDRLTHNYITNLKMDADPPAVAFETFDGADTIKVGVTGDLPPLDLILADGTPAGFNTALLSEIGKRLHKNIEIVQIKTSTRADALVADKIDVSFWAIIPINEGMPIDIDKPQGVELSTPYFADDVVHVELKK